MDENLPLEETFQAINISQYQINDNFETGLKCEICFCRADCGLFNILRAKFMSISLSKMLNYFSSIKDQRVIESSFMLCLLCVNQLVSSYLFLEKLKKSNEKLEKLLKNEVILDNQLSIETSNLKCLNEDVAKDHDYNEGNAMTDSLTNKKTDIVDYVGITNDDSYIETDVNKLDKPEVAGDKIEIEKIHILIEDNANIDKKCICKICDRVFTREKSLNLHLMKIHSTERPFSCPSCGKQFSLKTHYDKHLTLHKEDELYICNLCKKGFRTAGLLRSHISSVHRDKELMCIYCSKMFKLKLQLKRHVLGVHNVLLPENKRLNVNKEKVVCEVCGRKCNKYLLKAHMERHSGSKKYQCEMCGQKFFRLLSLNNHMIRHQDPKFSCEYCGKSHFTKQEMQTHIRRQHTREIICNCQHCGKGFVHQSNLIQHIKNCHPSDNDVKFVEPKIPKQCTVCGKMYSSRTSLIHHRRRAHENKEYSCSECSMTFRNLVPYKKHLKKRHNIGDTHNCDICSKSFYTKEELYKHKKRTHQAGSSSWYLCCTVCETAEKFKTKHELLQHIQSKHLKDSSTETPILYECSICLTFFLNFDSLREHLKTDHPDKTDNDFVILEYEIGGCRVQYFRSKRNIEGKIN